MNFYQTINEAIADIEANGFDSKERIDRWMQAIDRAVRNQMMPEAKMDEVMRRTMHDIYSRLVERGGILKEHKGVTFFKLEHVKPKLRAELDRRIMASAQLIRLNREQAIAKTLQRFSGWSTSIPAGGSKAVDKSDVKEDLKKALKSLPFTERRVLIDQGHKFTASLNDILAIEGGAIAGRWSSHFRQPGYNYRVDHKDRDGRVWLIRDNWAQKAGLCKPGKNGYTDSITAPGEEVFCFPGDLAIPFADGVTKAYRRWYDGEMAEIVTSSGETLRGTPNHPVLTSNGWIALGSLQKGDNVAEISNELRQRFEENQNNRVATISEIFAALQENGVTQTLNLRPTDFHGDGADGYVDVVFSTGELTFGFNPELAQSKGQFALSESNISTSTISALHQSVERLGLATKGIVSSSDTSSASVRGHLLHADHVGSAAISDCNSFPDKSLTKRNSTDAQLFAQGEQAFTSGIRFTQVVNVKRFAFSGHVFNLQTRNEWYVASTIVAHNCRCKYVYVYSLRELPDDMLTNLGRAKLAEVSAKARS